MESTMKLRLILIHLPSIQNISLIKRKLTPFGKRSRPQTLLLKWKVEDRVDGRGEMDEDEKKLKSKDGGKDLQRRAMIHEDFEGHKGRIEGGDLQWMAAGKGIVHSEMPSSIGTQRGLQLWINLSSKHKMV
ncbi:pirin-like protein [Cucumis melo var. makuwa]|uniref:Pirin-like protein n=1 Tax=Cucumis melo var. makuwa TaxID=1194695 RepID=A0A5D3BAI1_CUCMM|nr:pirin-like protein [Cucumis melo var. makuwa]TYJ96842.1 pirin-like protein [Cucumis melo var. makuwa]